MAKKSVIKSNRENPAEVALVIDVSGSMGDYSKLELAKAASIKFINLMRLEKDSLGICSFHTDAKYEWGTNNKVQLLDSSTTKIEACDSVMNLKSLSATNMGAGLEFAGTMFSSLQTDKKAIVLLSDGEDTVPGDTEVDIANGLNKDNKRIYTVAIGRSADKDKLKRIAGDDDRFNYADSTFSINEVFNKIIDQIGIAQLLLNEIIKMPSMTSLTRLHPLEDNTVPAGVNTVIMAIAWDNIQDFKWAGLSARYPTKSGDLVFNIGLFAPDGSLKEVSHSRIQEVENRPGVVVFKITNASEGEHYGCEMSKFYRDQKDLRFSVGIFV